MLKIHSKNEISQEKRIRHSSDLMASRIGSFPLEIALEAIADYGNDPQTILDPFCGKGTTLTAGALLCKRVFGIDASPEAVALSMAKIQPVSAGQIYDYINNLKIRSRRIDRIDPRVRIYFHDKTLGQILALRELIESDIAQGPSDQKKYALFTRGLMLGILHGHSANSLSVSSSHSISFSPNYVKKYCEENNLYPPERDVKLCLTSHAKKVLADKFPARKNNSVILGSAENAAKIFSFMRGKVDLVLTSPPYLHKQTYAKDNWLRLWFLGHEYQEVRQNLIETASLPLYRNRIDICLRQFYKLVKKRGRIILVTGTVRKSRKIGKTSVTEEINLGKEIAELCSNISGLRVLSTIEQNIESHSRYFGALVNSNGHSHYRRQEQLVIVEKYA